MQLIIVQWFWWHLFNKFNSCKKIFIIRSHTSHGKKFVSHCSEWESTTFAYTSYEQSYYCLSSSCVPHNSISIFHVFSCRPSHGHMVSSVVKWAFKLFVAWNINCAHSHSGKFFIVLHIFMQIPKNSAMHTAT